MIMLDRRGVPTPRLLTSGEAARAIGVTTSTLHRWWQRGNVTPTEVTVGGHARWSLDELRAQIRALNAARREKPPADDTKPPRA